MDDIKRAELKLLVERYTAANTASRETAKAALVETGIYTPDGKLSANYGGEPKTHTQIAMLSDRCIKGVFIPR